MNGEGTRRTVIRSCVAAMLLSPSGYGAIARAAAVRGPITLPEGPLFFTRSLRRELAGGYSIVAQRGFELHFTRLADGFLIRGEQISSTVDAPPSLEAFAQIERERVELGMFPLELDTSGRIRSGPATVPTASLEQAVDMAFEVIRAKVSDENRQREISSFIIALEQAAGQISGAMPPDLFVPPRAPGRIIREMVLPGGETGRLTSEFVGRISPETGLMSDAERIIITEAGGTSRQTIERWRLAPAN